MAAAEGTRRRPGRPRGRDGQAVSGVSGRRRGRPGPAGKGLLGERPRRGVRAGAAGVPAGLGEAFFEPIEAAAPRAPDPGLINEDFQPTLAADRTFSAADMAALWVGLVVCVPTWYLAGGLVEMGMSWLQGIATVFVGNLICLAPVLLNAQPGTKYGIPFPVLSRAVSFPAAAGAARRPGRSPGLTRPSGHLGFRHLRRQHPLGLARRRGVRLVRHPGETHTHAAAAPGGAED